jgi:ribosome-associated heat shock protein Hsp15
MDADRQRLDRWLWHARVVKTRELAKALIEGGHVRVDRERETKAGSAVKRGQTLTVTLPSRVLVLRVVDFVERRGSAEVAARLYDDLSPPRPPREPRPETIPLATRDPGAGRPTKRDRRALDRLTPETDVGMEEFFDDE